MNTVIDEAERAEQAAAVPHARTRRTTWFGHPKGLTVLFLTQTWADFSYNGMRALLVYYLIKALGQSQEQASVVYGASTAFLYLTPIAGGILSDRVLGPRRSIIAGSLIMALGHFLMASEHLVYVALATIAIGNGFFLPSLPAQVSQLYAEGDMRRDRAFTVYYMGINLGAMLAPILCGYLGERWGWHYGFGLAGIGMLVGLVVYLAGARYLPPDPGRRAHTARQRISFAEFDRKRVVLMLSVLAIVILFRGAYEQIGNTIALWADSGVDRTITLNGEPFVLPMTWFQSLNPMLVIALTPILAILWARQAKRGAEPTTMRKMAFGSLMVGFAYLQAAGSIELAGGGQVGPWVLVAYFFLLTLGELFILPIGLGLFARLAPPSFSAFCVAVWFSAIAAGNLVAGTLGTLWSQISPPQFFLVCAAVTGTAAILLRSLDPAVQSVVAPETNPPG